MTSSEYQTPGLASILATLAAYAPTPPPQPQKFPSAPPEAAAPEFSEEEYLPPPAEAPRTSNLRPSQQHHEVHRAPPPIDPATLTTWPSALRCVTRSIACNEAAMARIRQLIRTQRQHEHQWWDGREALVRKQKQRGEGRRAVDHVLKAVGGKVDSTRGDPTPEEDQAELYCYDRKVHAACTSMIKATTLELKILGVPFFGMKSDLIVCNTDVAEDVVISDAGWKAREGKIEEKELEKLQRKMLELLEDLCKE